MPLLPLVLLADVEVRTREQRLIEADTRFARSKLDLARAIGLPLGQEVQLTDAMPSLVTPPLTVEQAVARLGWDGLPADLAEVATLRLAHPDASLAELGAMLDPPRSKGGVLGRLRRIQALTAPVTGSEQ